MEAQLNSTDTRLTSLEERVDRRLQETRPIWESVLAQLKEVNTRLTRVENEHKDFRRMFRSAFSDMSRIQDDFEERLDKFEGRDVR
jgi:predicted nuclease with TOPRIM domain